MIVRQNAIAEAFKAQELKTKPSFILTQEWLTDARFLNGEYNNHYGPDM